MKRLFFTILAITVFIPLSAQDTISSSLRHIHLDIPLTELPYQQSAIQTTGGFFPSYMNPGMSTSLALSQSLYTAAHWGLQQIHYSDNVAKQRYYSRLAIYGFDLVSTWLPIGYAWLHEEYHRAAMTHRGVNSFNEVLLFKIGSNVISVSRETDEDMARLSDLYRPDFIRTMAAGHEGQTLQNQRLQRDDFFYHRNLDNEVILLNNALNNTAYLAICAWGLGDKTLRQMNTRETAVASRDFTGYDMMAWAHALFNPETPYTARGIHPSGVGIDRYITSDDLSAEAIRYLRRQTFVDLLNSLSPTLIGIARFPLGPIGAGQAYGNFAFRHYLTSFGDDNSLELLFQLVTPDNVHPLNAYLTLHNYNNYHHHFGGLEMGIVDYPLFRQHLLLSSTLQGWLQPYEQRRCETLEGGLADYSFFTSQAIVGGSVTLRVTANLYANGRANALCQPYLEMGYKSKGWQAGNVHLLATPYLNAGLLWQL